MTVCAAAGTVLMTNDISNVLNDWPFDPQGAVRKIVGEDGQDKIQMRVRIGTFHGILQIGCDGRPDGAHPYGGDFALDHYEAILSHKGGDNFGLNHQQCEELFEESAMTYERYVVLLQLGDWDRVALDTTRNMRLFRFVNRHAENESDRMRLEKWWPYILRIHHTARASQLLDQEDLEGALNEIHDGMLVIGALNLFEDEIHEMERVRSLKALEEFGERIRSRLPQDEVKRLEGERDQAVDQQDYERAAVLRDRIRRLRSEKND